MKYDVKLCELVRTAEIAADTYDFTVRAPELAAAAKPGQFAHIYVPGRTLRRPISICDIDRENGTLRFVFQIRGAGTADLAKFKVGDSLDILAPLGNGFSVEPGKKALFVGGGIGVPPLLGAAKHYGENAVVAVGFRSADYAILTEDFRAAGCAVRVATDDGSLGHHGLVTDLIRNVQPDIICVCGPMVMLRAVAAYAKENGVRCEISPPRGRIVPSTSEAMNRMPILLTSVFPPCRRLRGELHAAVVRQRAVRIDFQFAAPQTKRPGRASVQRAVAIPVVAEQRMPEVCHVRAQLMRPPRHRLQQHARNAARLIDHAVARFNFLRARFPAMDDADLCPPRILAQPRPQHAL